MASLKKNISWTFAGNVAFSASQWLIVILITKMLGVEQLGIYALGMAIVSPIFMFTNLSLRSVQATDVLSQYSFTEYLSFRSLTLVVAIFVASLFAYFSGYERDVFLVILVLTTIKVFESISDVYFGMYQRSEKMEMIGRSLIYRSFLSITIAVVASIVFRDLIVILCSVVVTYLIVLMLFDMRRLDERAALGLNIFGKKARVTYKRLLIITFPLGVTLCINVLYQGFPRMLLAKYHGVELLGIFSGISYLIVVGSTVINAMGQSAIPRLAKYAKKGQNDFDKLLSKLFFMSMVVGVLGILFAAVFSDLFLSFVYSSEFLGQRKLFVLLMVLALIMYMSGVAGSALTSMQCFKEQAYISIVCIAVLIFASFPLIKSMQAEGATYAMTIAYGMKLIFELITVYFKRSKFLVR